MGGKKEIVNEVTKINKLLYNVFIRRGIFMEINKTKCNSCGMCETVCVRRNINIENYTIGDECFGCYHCMAICPNGAISDKGKISPVIKNSNINSADFENLILNKRSNRTYTDQEIQKKELEKIAELLRFSPTGTNTQKLFLTILGSRKKVKEAKSGHEIIRLQTKTAHRIFAGFIFALRH